MSNLGHAFKEFIDYNFVNIDGLLCERVSENTFNWNGFIGTKEELREHIKGVWEKVANNDKNKKP